MMIKDYSSVETRIRESYAKQIDRLVELADCCTAYTTSESLDKLYLWLYSFDKDEVNPEECRKKFIKTAHNPFYNQRIIFDNVLNDDTVQFYEGLYWSVVEFEIR